MRRLEDAARRVLDGKLECSPEEPWRAVSKAALAELAAALAESPGRSERTALQLILEAVTQADPGQPHVEFANIEAIAAEALRLPDRAEREAPKPADRLIDESGNTVGWLDSAWSVEDIIEEWDWLELTPEKLREEWYACRWTTDEEKADPDVLYELFGDYEMSSVDTSAVVWRVKAGTPGAHKYLVCE